MTTQLSTNDLIATIEDLGYKITTPRRDLINLLCNKNEGFTAEEISKEIEKIINKNQMRKRA